MEYHTCSGLPDELDQVPGHDVHHGISIPPLLGWKKDPDRGWFYEIKEHDRFRIPGLSLQNLREKQFQNFTQTLKTELEKAGILGTLDTEEQFQSFTY